MGRDTKELVMWVVVGFVLWIVGVISVWALIYAQAERDVNRRART